MSADQTFTLEVVTVSRGTCVVQVDGGVITLAMESTFCDQPGASFSDVAAPRPGPAKCQIPALPAGTYVVNSDPPTTFSIPTSPDAGIANCL